MSIVVVGDVGPVDGKYHAGDEAMLLALLHELRARDFDSFTVISANPNHSHESFGAGAVNRIGFDAAVTKDREQRESRLALVVAAATGAVTSLDRHDAAWPVIDAIAASDGVVIAGGGNLSSVWPEHLYERSAIVAIAGIFGKPVVVTGQTLGPALLGRDGQLLAELLNSAQLIGLRERASFALAEQLGVDALRLRLTRDDALFVPTEPVDAGLTEPYCAVTLSAYSELASPELYRAELARFLDAVSAETGLRIVFVPHLGSLDAAELADDSAIHRDVARLMTGARVTQLPVLTAAQVAYVTKEASLCVSTRYHPVVFAAAGGVASIGISVDDYTALKIGGAAHNVGLADWSIPVVALAAGLADSLLRETWARRDEIREHLRVATEIAQSDAARWFNEVAAVLRAQPHEPTPFTVTAALRVEHSEAARRSANPSANPSATPSVTPSARLSDWSSASSRQFAALRLSWVAEQEQLQRLSDEAAAAEAAYAQVAAELEHARERLREADAATVAAHALVSEIAEPLFELQLRSHNFYDAARELDAVYRTRTFRWTKPARSVYGVIRRRWLHGAQRDGRS